LHVLTHCLRMSIRNPPCLYLYVCETCCLYGVCIYPKIHTHTCICNKSVFCLYCMTMYVCMCMCMYMYVSTKTFQDIQTYTDNTYSYIQYIQYIQYMQIHTDTHHTRKTNNSYIYMQYRYIHAIHTMETYSYDTLKYIQYILIYTDVCMYMYMFVFACITCIM
jgi:hypothetical protein